LRLQVIGGGHVLEREKASEGTIGGVVTFVIVSLKDGIGRGVVGERGPQQVHALALAILIPNINIELRQQRGTEERKVELSAKEREGEGKEKEGK